MLSITRPRDITLIVNTIALPFRKPGTTQSPLASCHIWCTRTFYRHFVTCTRRIREVISLATASGWNAASRPTRRSACTRQGTGSPARDYPNRKGLRSTPSFRTTAVNSPAAPITIPTNCLQLEGIEHRTTRVRRPQSNGFIERLHRTLLDEHFRVKGRTTWYESGEQMQADLDEYLRYYNHDRAHQGRMMEGRTPLTMFLEGLAKRPKREILRPYKQHRLGAGVR